MATMAEISALSAASSFSTALPTDSSSHAASLSSTPPTTVSPDSMSLASEPDHHKSDCTEPGDHLKTSIAPAPVLEAAIPLLEKATQDMQLQRDHTDAEPQDDQSHDEEVVQGAGTPVAQAIVVAEPVEEPASATRPRRARASLPVYNLAKLSGTDIHGKRHAKGDVVGEKRRRTVSGDTLVNGSEIEASQSTDTLAEANHLAEGETDVLNLDWSLGNPSTPKGARKVKKGKEVAAPAPATRRATRQYGVSAEALTTKISSIGSCGRKMIEQGMDRVSRELKRLQDTDEFAHRDKAPIRYTIWSNGKFVDPEEEKARQKAEAASPPRKKAKIDGALPANEESEETSKTQDNEAVGPVSKRRRVKKWLNKGLYAGQEYPSDITAQLTAQEKKKLAQHPQLKHSGEKVNRALPPPMFNGLRMLLAGRDFKLPFDVCNPLPPGQPKPANYRTITKNRFVGDASAYWKKTPVVEDFASRCVCKPDDGCGEDCQNRIMLYECDDSNCNVGKSRCTNRAFQDLQERTKKGGRYRVGVEVVKTGDRGYGVRSNRCFEPNQIIMEYTGEIITEEECERRMNNEYKNNECYYLMSFDQNMIIDATTGSIARFVNHSCTPNCRMIKWVVAGQPRMALFAGDDPIMTGEELTYDYNFDPFSAKNVQKCLCGAPNCRGVLGPKPREVKPPKPPKEDGKKVKGVKMSVKAGKRKLKDLLAGDVYDTVDANIFPKKRKVTGTGLLSSKATAIGKMAKGAVIAVKRGVSSISVVKAAPIKTTKAALAKQAAFAASKASPKTTKKSVKTEAAKKAPVTKKSSASVLKMYGKKGIAKGTQGLPKSSSNLTIVAASASSTKSGKTTKTLIKKGSKSATATEAKTSPRKRTPSRKVLESATAASVRKMASGIQKNKTSVSSTKRPLGSAKTLTSTAKSPKAKKALELLQSAQTSVIAATATADPYEI